MDERGKRRLLSSVYQPFVNVGPGLLDELEQFLGQTKSFYKQRHFDDTYILVRVVDLLAQLVNDVKVSLDGEIPNLAGWPLCTDRYVVCHLGDPLASLTNDCAVDRFATGDFYYSIIPVNDKDEIAFRLAFYYLDSTLGAFREIALEKEDFLTLLRNCGPSSTTENDRIVESIGRDRNGGKRRLFHRCVVRSGKNSVVELVSWKQLCHSSNGDGDDRDVYSTLAMPFLDFIDDDSPSFQSRVVSNESNEESLDQTAESRRVDLDDESVSAKAALSSSTAGSCTNRIPKRIGGVRSEFLSDGYLSFTGGRYQNNERYAIVEIRPLVEAPGSLVLDECTVADFASAVMYLYSIHKRWVRRSTADGDGCTVHQDFGLVLVVGAWIEQNGREYSVQNSSFLLWLKEVLRLFMHRISNGLEKIFFVDQCAEEIAILFSDMDNDTDAGQTQIATVKATELHERVAGPSEFSETFDGTMAYDRRRWVAFRQDLEQFMHSCQAAAKHCVSSTQKLKDDYSDGKLTKFWLADVSEVQKEVDCLKGQANEFDQYVIDLEQSGDGDLHFLEESFEDLRHVRSYRDAVEKVSALYAEVRKVMVKVRSGINRRVHLLETYAKAKKVLERNEQLLDSFGSMRSSLNAYCAMASGSRHSRIALKEFELYFKEIVQPTSSEATTALDGMLTDEELSLLSCEQKEIVMTSSSELRRTHDAMTAASNFALSRLRNLVSCHDFLDQAYDWALDGREMLNQLARATSTASTRPADDLQLLLSHLNSHPSISPDLFAEKLRLASEAGDEKLVIQCKAAQERCLNTERALFNWVKLLEESAGGEENIKSRTSPQTEARCVFSESERPVQCHRPCSLLSTSSSSLRSSQAMLETVVLDLSNSESTATSDKADFNGIITEDMTETVVSEISENAIQKKRVERLAAQRLVAATASVGRKWSLPVPPPPSADLLKAAADKSKLRRPFRKLMKRSNTCEGIITSKPTRHQSLESLPSISEESADGGTSKSVPLVNGNEVEGSVGGEVEDDLAEVADGPPPFKAPVPPPNFSCVATGRMIPSPPPDCSPNVRMQHMVVNELLVTEETYVASLQYVIEHYLTEMHRCDLPHQLLGQRLTIFGNVEKIFDFHVGQFLPELKQNCLEASDVLGAQVAKCFLKYRTKFHLYALYNKNKPKSDALMAECAAVFFRTKQLLLRDKLDLSSYLLKPVQRMGKYALMLQQLIKACPSNDQEQMEALKAAEEMITFQLRHGNDLLAMDSIQRSNMNLKEQGQLLRQDEFVVFEGRTSHKCVRRVFLFEHLVLFAKPRRLRAPSGVEREIYETKRCLKMSDIGMTEQVGDSDLKFELWFLRHTSGQRFILQAPSSSIRLAWVSCVRKILWHQALSNRELRKAETTSMGENLCVDLKPSKDRIEDRALNASLLMKVAHPRSVSSIISHSSTCNDFSASQSKRPHSLISVDSSTSSSNVSSATDSTGGSRLQGAAVLRNSINIRTSSESGICCDFGPSDARSSCIGDTMDECRSMPSRPLSSNGNDGVSKLI